MMASRIFIHTLPRVRVLAVVFVLMRDVGALVTRGASIFIARLSRRYLLRCDSSHPRWIQSLAVGQ